jgi:hypothetical protein
MKQREVGILWFFYNTKWREEKQGGGKLNLQTGNRLY